jgi:hypothetical protein
VIDYTVFEINSTSILYAAQIEGFLTVWLQKMRVLTNKVSKEEWREIP